MRQTVKIQIAFDPEKEWAKMCRFEDDNPQMKKRKYRDLVLFEKEIVTMIGERGEVKSEQRVD